MTSWAFGYWLNAIDAYRIPMPCGSEAPQDYIIVLVSTSLHKKPCINRLQKVSQNTNNKNHVHYFNGVKNPITGGT